MSTNESHQRVVGHILRTFKEKKGAPYPFTSADGRTVKFLLGLYEVETVLALWDLFIDADDEWIRRTGHKISEFQRQIPMLLDRDWKGRARKYEAQSGIQEKHEAPTGEVNSIKEVFRKLAE